MARTTALVPVERGRAQDWRLPTGTPYVILEHDPGEREQAVAQGARNADTEFVLVVEPDAAVEPHTLRELEAVCWDADAAYPSLAFCEGDFDVKRTRTAPFYCRQRLERENFVGPTALIRRERLLEAGGWSGSWATWLRLRAMKPAGQAYYLLRSEPPDEPEPDTNPTPAVATFWAQGTQVTAYLRCQLPARYLPGVVRQYFPSLYRRRHRGPRGRFTGGSTAELSDPHEGAAVWQYPGDAIRRELVALMQRNGIRVLAEVDDDYLQMDKEWAKKAGWSSKPDGIHSTRRHRVICAEADGVIVTTRYLERRYRKVARRVFVCPNQVDPEDWPDPTPDDGVLRIGWFAGGSHRRDASLIGDALAWASRQDGVEVWLMGAGAHRTLTVEEGVVVDQAIDVWPEFREARFHHIPPTNDLGAYRQHMTRLDVGLAPVRRGPSADGRSDLKAIEYAAAGAFPVLSDAPAYEDWRDGEHCRKAVRTRDFLNVVKDLVRDPDGTKRLAAEARAHVLAERTVQRNIWRWQEALQP